MRDKFTRYAERPGLLLLLAAVVPLMIGLFWRDNLAADAYPLLRQAHNLAVGRGLYFDTAVTGSTHLPSSPLFLLLLTAADWLQLPPHHAAWVLSALGWGGTAVILLYLGRTWARPLAGSLAALLLIGSPVLIDTMGQTVSWAVGMGWLAAGLGDRQKWRWQTAVLLLLLLLHLDLAVFLFTLALWLNRPPDRKRGSGLLIPAAGLIGLGLFVWQFGLTAIFTLPQPEQWLAGGQALVQESELYLLFLPWLLLGLWVQERRLLPLLFWLLAAALSGSALAGGVTAVTLTFLTGLGIDGLFRWLRDSGQTMLAPHRLALGLAVIAILPLAAAQMTSVWQRTRLQPQARLAGETEVAAWLQHNSPETASLAASPRLAYLADRPLQVDGRLSGPAALPATLRQLLLQPPDYFITFRSPNWTYLTQTSWFQERFEEAHQFPSPYDPGAPLIVWQHAPTPFDQVEPTPLNVEAEAGIDLVGYQITPRRIQPGEAINVQLNWQSSQTAVPYLRTVLRVATHYDQVVGAQRDMDTPRSLPPEWIEPGMIFPERFVLTTTVDISVGAYPVIVSLYRPREGSFVALYQNEDTNALDRVNLGYVTVPWEGSIAETAVPINATFGDQITLLSCDCPETAVPGATITMQLYWTALRPPDDSYTVFVHLLDDTGQFITGHDAPPLDGNYVTAAWEPGDIIPDAHPLALPPDLPPGTYTLRAGLYQPESGIRLPAADAQGNLSPDQAIWLPSIKVSQNN